MAHEIGSCPSHSIVTLRNMVMYALGANAQFLWHKFERTLRIRVAITPLGFSLSDSPAPGQSCHLKRKDVPFRDPTVPFSDKVM
jgi:hypothetical protein